MESQHHQQLCTLVPYKQQDKVFRAHQRYLICLEPLSAAKLHTALYREAVLMNRQSKQLYRIW